MRDLTRAQLVIMQLALDNLQGDLASNLNGWTIGENTQEMELFADTITIYTEVEELRKMIDREISNDTPSH